MKLELDRNTINLATSRAQGAISDRAFAQIGLSAQSGLVQLSASDRVLAVYSELECKVIVPGTVFVPGKLFSDIVKQLPEGQVCIETENAFLKITAGPRAEFMMKIPLLEDMTWKAPPEIHSDNTTEIPVNKIRYMIEQVGFCVEQDSPRNYGSVAFMHKPTNDTLRVVGTDGFRLSYCDTKLDLPQAFLKQGVCLSKRTLAEIMRMCNEGFESVRIAISDDQTTLLASSNNYKIFARLASVKYPNYQGVLPTANLSMVNLSRQGLQSVARRVLLAADKTNALKLRFSESSLTLSSKTMGSSEGKESIALDDFKGETNLSVNGKFLSDVFSTVNSDELTLQFKGQDDPIVIIPREEPKNCRSMHVLVPIRENG